MKGITDEQAQWPIVVAAPVTTPLFYADNLVEPCHFCDRKVQLRPHNPSPRIVACLACWQLRVQPHDAVMMTEETMRELLLDRVLDREPGSKH